MATVVHIATAIITQAAVPSARPHHLIPLANVNTRVSGHVKAR